MRAPGWDDIISEAIDARLEDFHTAEVGWVTSFDPASLTCSAQPAMAQGYIDEQGERRTITKPPCRHARVAYQGGIVFRLEPNDPVIILYSSAALDNWRPDKNKVVDPGDDRRNNMSDALVIPLGRSSERPDKNQIIIEHDKVSLGKKGLTGTRSPVARKSDLQSIYSAMSTSLATLSLAPVTNAQAIAALTPVVQAFQAAIAAMSTNVEAT